jgi:ribosomal protein S18 acetylase RimI-like enzyme
MKDLPKGYTVRPMTMSDVAAVAEIVNAYGRRFTGADLTSAERLESEFSTPGFDLENSTCLAIDPENQVVAFSTVFDVVEPHVRVNVWAVVPPEHQGRGIGSALYDWLTSRARKAVEKAPDGARVTLHQNVFEGDAAAAAFLTSRGFVQTRHFWRMAIDLESGSEAPQWPLGIHPCTVDVETGLEDCVRAAYEAFRDHYGFVEGSFEQQLEMTRHRIESDPEHDPELNFVAKDGDRIAGVCLCRSVSGTDRNTGYVGVLGVLRPWRRRGLGLALLLEAFERFRRKGKKRAHLHVDAQSPTGATHLYEKAGMYVDQLNHEYTLELRPGKDLATH